MKALWQRIEPWSAGEPQPAFIARIQAAAAVIEGASETFRIDAAAAGVVAGNSLILATYRALRDAGLEQAPALQTIRDIMGHWMRGNVEQYTAHRFDIDRARGGAAFAQVQANFKSRGERQFGAYFRYVVDERDEHREFINIERCLFNDFFRHHGAAELIPMFCAQDMI